MYKRHIEAERRLRLLNGHLCIFSYFEKLDAIFLDFLSFVLMADGRRHLYQRTVVNANVF